MYLYQHDSAALTHLLGCQFGGATSIPRPVGLGHRSQATAMSCLDAIRRANVMDLLPSQSENRSPSLGNGDAQRTNAAHPALDNVLRQITAGQRALVPRYVTSHLLPAETMWNHTANG
jgi:hypothetical protein